MNNTIKIAILAAILIPGAAFGNPHGGKKNHPAPPIRVAPVRNHPPKPMPQPTPMPVRHPRHHRHHHPVAVAVVVASGRVYNPVPNVVNVSMDRAVLPSVERTLTTSEFLGVRDRFVGQRVSVVGRVTQAIRGMGDQDCYILDGVVRCEIPHDIQSSNRVQVGTGHYVTVTGTVLGSLNAAASADLVECAHAF